MIEKIIEGIENRDRHALSKAITFINNRLKGYKKILGSIKTQPTPIIGITGIMGSGKSTLVNVLIKKGVEDKKKVGVVAIDPSSYLHHGSILGDRIRMNAFSTNPNVFIRSLSTRGHLGGGTAYLFDVLQLFRAFDFDLILVETVGVGQSELEICGLSDKTYLVLTPQQGDDIQMLKSGIMEIADTFIINKADMAEYNTYLNLLRLHLQDKHDGLHIFSTIATKNEGIDKLYADILKVQKTLKPALIEYMKKRVQKALFEQWLKKEVSSTWEDVLAEELQKQDFNLYRFLQQINAHS